MNRSTSSIIFLFLNIHIYHNLIIKHISHAALFLYKNKIYFLNSHEYINIKYQYKTNSIETNIFIFKKHIKFLDLKNILTITIIIKRKR
ncbi:hypothetical protein PFNF135_02642 [Plasmodium falciparum NF135/5.C10]|uniref:Uncharacterized protein n=1 Tax=Plasmodium falciparum NF135/5.C10 TaxID=1036726 RepID=W4IHK2_PLAFA|nr:hypothetical protein PFNF135_02642 [Plasmodium falciparum NF135/5.C10]